MPRPPVLLCNRWDMHTSTPALARGSRTLYSPCNLIKQPVYLQQGVPRPSAQLLGRTHVNSGTGKGLRHKHREGTLSMVKLIWKRENTEAELVKAYTRAGLQIKQLCFPA